MSYSPDENDKENGIFRTIPCGAIWSSGVSKSFSTTWDLKEFPDGVRGTLQRPRGEGYSQDAEFALKIQNMKSQRRAAKAAEDAALQRYLLQNETTTCNPNYIGGFTCRWLWNIKIGV